MLGGAGAENSRCSEQGFAVELNFTTVEVDKALASMHPLKSLGLDGFAA